MGLKPRLRPIEWFVLIVGVTLVVATSLIGASATRESVSVAPSNGSGAPALYAQPHR